MSRIHMTLLGDAVAYADQWVSNQQERRDLPGAVVAVWRDGQLLLAKGYGFADLEQRVPMTPKHIFRIASHSKTFTATAIMQLVEGKALRLDDKLADYIPWLQQVEGLAEVTIRQTLNHSGALYAMAGTPITGKLIFVPRPCRFARSCRAWRIRSACE